MNGVTEIRLSFQDRGVRITICIWHKKEAYRQYKKEHIHEKENKSYFHIRIGS